MEKIVEMLSNENIPYAVLDKTDAEFRILISSDDKKRFKALAKKAGLSILKDKSGDLYLYGMEHFLYYVMGDVRLTVCCQMACRSTLNGEWVPLDRKINIKALDRRCFDEETGAYVPSNEDYLCYMLAKCVYTEKEFSDYDKKRIEKCMTRIDMKTLEPKLKGVFFQFTDKLLDMLDKKEYNDIREALYMYAEY